MKPSFPKIHFKIQINKTHNLSTISDFKVTNDKKKPNENKNQGTERGHG